MQGTPPKHVLSTSHLWRSLSQDKRFEQVLINEATPGDIVIACRSSQANGYAGIVVDHGRIVSNGSKGVQDDSSLVEIQHSRIKMAVFRYNGGQGHRSYALANQHDISSEPRLPKGQTARGEWTTNQAADLKRASVSKKGVIVQIYHKGGGGGALSTATKEDINRILQAAFAESGVDAGVQFIETDMSGKEVGAGMYNPSSSTKIATVHVEAVDHGPMGWAAPGKLVGQYNQKEIATLLIRADFA